MTRMCLGFCFNPADNTVLLMRKNRPDWQAGKLNGVGGHVNDGETSRDAMVREFKEETDCAMPDFLWEQVGRMEHIQMTADDKPGWTVSVFMICTTRTEDIKTTTDEPLEWVPVSSLTALAAGGQCIENIPVLVALCLLPPAPPSNRRPDFVLRY